MYPTSSDSETETAKIDSAAEKAYILDCPFFPQSHTWLRKVATEISDQLQPTLDN